MLEEILKSIPVLLFASLKFILGPTLGFAAKLYFVTTVLVTVAGMMLAVFVVTYLGEWIRNKFFHGRPIIKVNEKWKKHGPVWIAFFTPLFLTPIGGTILALSTGTPRERIIFYMFVSASGWALVFSGIIYFFGYEVLPEFVK